MSTYDSVRNVARLSITMLLAVFCGAVGLLQDNRILVAMAEALAVLLAISWLYVRFAGRRLEIRRTVEPRASEGDRIPVTLQVRNRFWLPLVHLEVRDWFSADFVSLKRMLVDWVGLRDVEIRYEAKCDLGRGRYDVGPAEVVIADPLGLFRRLVRVGETSELIVYPQTFPVADLHLQEVQCRFPMSSPEAAYAGQAATFYGTREYRPGDNYRNIHWPSTVKWGRIILKEFESDTQFELTVFLDAAQASIRGRGRGTNVEAAVRIGASLADFAIQRLHGCRLIYDSGTPAVLPVRAGAAHRMAILEALARFAPTGSNPYRKLVGQGLRLVPDGSAVVLILNVPDADADGWVGILGELRSRGVRVLPVILDAATYDAGAPSGSVENLVQTFEHAGLSPRIVRAGDDLAAHFGRAN